MIKQIEIIFYYGKLYILINITLTLCISWLLPKNQIENMQTHLLEPLPIYDIQDSPVFSCSSTLSVFDKYKYGEPPRSSAFRIYSTDFCMISDSQKNLSSEHRNRGSYRKYTLEQKEEAVAKILNGHDVKEVSRQYGIPRRNLLRWRKNGCERKEGGGRPTDAEMESILYDKIKKQQIKGQKQIRQMAIKVSRSQSFKASKGWYSKFCRRYKLQTGEEI